MKCQKQLPLNGPHSDTIQTSGFTGRHARLNSSKSSAPGGIEMSSGYLNDHLEGLYIPSGILT